MIKPKHGIENRIKRNEEYRENSLHQLGNSTLVRYLSNHSEIVYLEDPGYSAMEKVIDSIMDEFMKTKTIR